MTVPREQWARLDAIVLDLRVCEGLTGANGGAECEDTGGRDEERRGAAAGIGVVADVVPLPVTAADQAAEAGPALAPFDGEETGHDW